MFADVKIFGKIVRNPTVGETKSRLLYAKFPFLTDSNFVNDDGHQKQILMEVIAWDRQAENIVKYCKEGSKIVVTGIISELSIIEKKDGSPFPKLTITLEKFKFVK